MYANAHAPLDEETITPTTFSSADNLHALIIDLYGLEGLPKMDAFFRNLSHKDFAFAFIADIRLLTHKKFFHQLHQRCPSNTLEVAAKTSLHILLTVKFPRHELAKTLFIPTMMQSTENSKFPLNHFTRRTFPHCLQGVRLALVP